MGYQGRVRRGALTALGLILALSLLIPRPAASRPQPDLGTALAEATGASSGAVSVVVLDLQSGYAFEHDAGASVEAASLFKLFVMAALYRRAQDDPSILAAAVPVVRPRIVGEHIEFRTDAEPVSAALEQMIDWSDNGATFALVELLGTDEVNATVASLGLHDTVVSSGEAIGNVTSARDVALFFELLARRQIVSSDASDAMTWLLLHQGINDRLSRGMPSDALFAHKTGNSAGTFHDAGIVWTPWGQRVVVVLTAGAEASDALALMEDVGYWTYTLPVPEARGAGLATGATCA